MTRGFRSSEFKAVIAATAIGLCLAVYGIQKGTDLSALGVLIGVVVSPLSIFYPASRVAVKRRNGEKDD